MNINLTYPVKVTKNAEGYFAEFRDIENAFTDGDSYEEVLVQAQDVLGAMLQSLAKHNHILPEPSPVKNDEVLLSPFPEVAAPLELYLLRKRRNKTVEDVARKLSMSKQRYSEIERGKNLTLKTLRKAASALRARAHISLLA